MWLVLTLIGCDLAVDQALSGKLTDEERAGLSVRDAWLTCETDSDCEYVPVGCCGCELGGVSIAINVDHVEDYLASNDTVCTDDTFCLLYTSPSPRDDR